MSFDFTLFDIINGLAGRWALLDVVGSFIAIYGMPAALIIAAGALWWPGYGAAERRAYFRSLIVAGLMVAALIGLEVLLARVLHHELRARPYNGRWVNVLISEVSYLSFPAWPVAIVMAVAVPLMTIARKIAAALLVIGGLLAFSLVFVGVNFPLDVLTGALLGTSIGYTAWLIGQRTSFRNPQWRKAGVMWAAFAVWSVLLAVSIPPASMAYEGEVTQAESRGNEFAVALAVPTSVSQSVQQAALPNMVNMTAATNKHIIVARAHVTLKNPSATLAEIKSLARKVCNASFSGWAKLDLLTIDVVASISDGDKTKTGTQYTVMIERSECPLGGFADNARLPGKKFYHSRFFAR